MDMEWTEMTALELGEAIRAGEVTIPEVTQGFLDKISRENPRINALITVTAQEAMERAKALQQGLRAGLSPLYGVPMALKDNLCTQGVRTTCASRILGDFKPPYISHPSP